MTTGSGQGPLLPVALCSSLLLAGCASQPPSFDDTAFVHERPRFFIEHQPIWPGAGDDIVVTVVSDTDSGRPDRTSITLVSPAQGLVTHHCGAGHICQATFTGPHGNGTAIIGASVEEQGAEVKSRSGFSLTVGHDTDGLVRLRVPFVSGQPVDEGAFRILLVRDDGGGAGGDQPLYSRDGFREDIETFFYNQLFLDPAYRWRDQQLAFWHYPGTARVADYKSGSATRCGSLPWTYLDTSRQYPSEVSSLSPDVIGVFHLHDNPVHFRDCAGRFIPDNDVATFSADGRVPAIAHHELGHALLGLGDEFWESEQSRAMPAATDLVANCCCRDGSGTSIPISSGGSIAACVGLEVIDAGSCDGLMPPQCVTTADALCPPLQGSCANLFESLALCQAAAKAISINPAIESRHGRCRQLCDTADRPCSCDPRPLWVYDLRNPAADAAPDGGQADIMGTTEGSGEEGNGIFMGPTGAACLERQFCLQWEQEVVGHIPTFAESQCGPLFQPGGRAGALISRTACTQSP